MPPATITTAANNRDGTPRWLPWALLAFVSFMLFYRLGAPALFEPDEGRNAEKAREILILNDWVTPHGNFHPVLDKPIFFYWLIAISLKLFGITEWSARLPSALAALSCIVIVYFFVRRWWGEPEARWSALALATSAGFFIFARLVIFDMTLTAFITLALWAFYQAAHEPGPKANWFTCVLLYIALGAATLTKGLVGLVVPGMIFFFYLLLNNSWPMLGRIRLVPGVFLFLLVVAPWYVLAESHNPGYLRYYFWEEHFGRFITNKFDRYSPWYFYLYVTPLGLLPWSFLLPTTIANFWRNKGDDKMLWVGLWAVLPILFFSISTAKLPHYILPSFPALAILTGIAIPRVLGATDGRSRYGFTVGWLMISSLFVYSIGGVIYPEVLAKIARGRFDNLVGLFAICAALALALAYVTAKRTLWTRLSSKYMYYFQAAGLLLFLLNLAEMMVQISPAKSAKEIAQKALPLLTPATQMVSYDTYAEGLPFYLKVERPIWVVTRANKERTFLGNFYNITGQPEPISPLGKGLVTYDEFRDLWLSATIPFVIVVKEKNFGGMEKVVGESPRKVAAYDEYWLVTRPSQ